MVFSHDARGDRAVQSLGQGLPLRVVDVALRVAVPLPVAQRKHTSHVQPAVGAQDEVQFEAHVACVHTREVHAGVVAVGHRAGTYDRLVHPERVVTVQVDRKDARAEPVAYLGREDLFVQRVGVLGVARGALQERAAREERGAADVAQVGEHVVFLVDVVVGASLDRVTDEVHVLGLGVCGVVVEAVVAPVAGVGNRTRYEGVEVFLRPLQLGEYAFLVYVAVVVAVNLVADL